MGTFLVFFGKLLSCCGLCIEEEELREPLKDGRELIFDNHGSNSITALHINPTAVSAPDGQQLGIIENGCMLEETESFPNLGESQKKQQVAQEKNYDDTVSEDDFSKGELKCLQNGNTASGSRPVESKKETPKCETEIQGYLSSHKILLVGEGNFSFSACLARAFDSATNIVATSLNSEEYLKCYYKEAKDNISELQMRGCIVLHDVDATSMANDSRITGLSFDRIIYNFPHCGDFGPSEDAIRKNQSLVRSFMENSLKLMKEDGEIHVRHKSNKFFRKWKVGRLGNEAQLKFFEETRLDVHAFEGYTPKYGFEGGKFASDDNFDCNPCRTYKFALHEYVEKLKREKRQLNKEMRRNSTTVIISSC